MWTPCGATSAPIADSGRIAESVRMHDAMRPLSYVLATAPGSWIPRCQWVTWKVWAAVNPGTSVLRAMDRPIPRGAPHRPAAHRPARAWPERCCAYGTPPAAYAPAAPGSPCFIGPYRHILATDEWSYGAGAEWAQSWERRGGYPGRKNENRGKL
jgi:hypothetical protein